MTKKTIVKWFVWDSPPKNGVYNPHELAYLDTLAIEPEPLYKFISDSRNKNYYPRHFLKCYALLDYCKNAFVIRSPIDLTLTIDEQNKFASIDVCDQAFFDRCINIRWSQTAPEDRLVFSIFPSYVFYADESVMMESMPMILTPNNNVLLIPGQFDIGKWIRPVDYSGEIIDPSKPIKFKRGEPLFVVRFNNKTGSLVELERVERTQQLTNLVANCVYLKTAAPFTPLSKLYEIFSSVLNLFKKSNENRN